MNKALYKTLDVIEAVGGMEIAILICVPSAVVVSAGVGTMLAGYGGMGTLGIAGGALTELAFHKLQEFETEHFKIKYLSRNKNVEQVIQL